MKIQKLYVETQKEEDEAKDLFYVCAQPKLCSKEEK